MQITIGKETFLEILNQAAHFTSNKLSSTTPLHGVYLKALEKKLHIYSTNLNSYFHTSFPVKESPTLSILIEPRRLIEFLTLLPAGDVVFEVSEKSLVVKKDKTKGVFPLIDSKEFPLPPDLSREKKQKIKTDFFLKNLPLVLFAASYDEARPALTGVNFIELDEELTLVATDGFRLSLTKVQGGGKIPNMLIPASFLDEVMRSARGVDEVEMFFSNKEKIVMIKVGESEFYSRLIDGEFPPFEKVIPQEHKTRATLETDEFLKNVKLASIFAREFSNIIICEFKKDGLYIKPKTDGEEQNTTYQEGVIEGEEQQIAFNFKFVADFLSKAGTKKVIVEVLRSDAPAVFRLEGNDKFLHIIMPVRIQT